MKYFLSCSAFFVAGFVFCGMLASSYLHKPKPVEFTINTMANSLPAFIYLMGTNGIQFGNIEIKPGKSVDWNGIDDVSMLAFSTNGADGSVFIHDWKRTNFGIRIWPGRK